MKTKIEFVVQASCPYEMAGEWTDHYWFDKFTDALEERREMVAENRKIKGEYKYRIVERHTSERVLLNNKSVASEGGVG